MAQKNGKAGATKPAIPTTNDYVVARDVYSALLTAWPTMFTDEEKERIDSAIREARVPYSWAKSGNGTKGSKQADKTFTVSRSENDPTKPVATVSAVCAESNRDSLLASWIHVFTAIAGYTYEADKPRIYTKGGFATICKRIGLDVEPSPSGKKSEQAYTRYTVPTTFLRDKLKDFNMPKMPFTYAGTKAAPPRKQFTCKGFDPEYPEAVGFFPLLNPNHPDVTEAECMNHAALYSHLTFHVSDKVHLQGALAYVTVEEVKAEEAPKAEEQKPQPEIPTLPIEQAS